MKWSKKMPFDIKRIVFAGFKVLLDARWPVRNRERQRAAFALVWVIFTC
jgi:hypothetical protein